MIVVNIEQRICKDCSSFFFDVIFILNICVLNQLVGERICYLSSFNQISNKIIIWWHRSVLESKPCCCHFTVWVKYDIRNVLFTTNTIQLTAGSFNIDLDKHLHCIIKAKIHCCFRSTIFCPFTRWSKLLKCFDPRIDRFDNGFIKLRKSIWNITQDIKISLICIINIFENNISRWPNLRIFIQNIKEFISVWIFNQSNILSQSKFKLHTGHNSKHKENYSKDICANFSLFSKEEWHEMILKCFSNISFSGSLFLFYS